MYMTTDNKAKLKAAVAFLCEHATAGHYAGISFSRDAEIKIQGTTLEAVREIRQCFPPATWVKNYVESCNWWEFTATYENDIKVVIYACTETPATCRIVTEEYDAVEQVPIITGYEDVTVTRKRTRVDCSGRELQPA